MIFIADCSQAIDRLHQKIDTADAIVIGVGAGMSTSAGPTYSDERFMKYFSDFHEKYGITDIYSGGFYSSRHWKYTGCGEAYIFTTTAMPIARASRMRTRPLFAI